MLASHCVHFGRHARDYFARLTQFPLIIFSTESIHRSISRALTSGSSLFPTFLTLKNIEYELVNRRHNRKYHEDEVC